MKNSALATLGVVGVIGLLSVASPATALTLDATGTTFRFGYLNQTVTDAGNLGSGGYPEGTSIRYDDVATINGTVIDAVVTYVEGTNLRSPFTSTLGHITRIDDEFPDDEEDPYVELTIGGDEQSDFAIAEITIGFFEAGTSTPVTITNLPMNIYDIDSLQWFEADGAAGYSVSTNTHLTVTNPSTGTYRFTSPDAETSSDDGTAFTVGRGKLIFAATSSVTVRVAIPNVPNDGPPGGSFDLDFSVGLPWSDEIGGSENTTNLPTPPTTTTTPSLPTTGTASFVLSGLAVAMILGGTGLVARRRLHN